MDIKVSEVIQNFPRETITQVLGRKVKIRLTLIQTGSIQVYGSLKFVETGDAQYLENLNLTLYPSPERICYQFL